MRTLLLITTLLISLWSEATDAKEVLQKVRDTYSSRNISYNTEYKLYKGHKSNTVHTSYKGEVYSFEGNTYQKIDNSEFIYTKSYSLTINHDEKEIRLDKANQVFQSAIDFDALFSEYKELKLTEKDDSYSVVLYVSEYSSLPCSLIKLEVDKNNYQVRRVDIYYSYLQDFSQTFGKQDLEMAHLRIEFTSINMSPEERKEVFASSAYVIGKGKLAQPSKKYQNYVITDNR